MIWKSPSRCKFPSKLISIFADDTKTQKQKRCTFSQDICDISYNTQIYRYTDIQIHKLYSKHSCIQCLHGKKKSNVYHKHKGRREWCTRAFVLFKQYKSSTKSFPFSPSKVSKYYLGVLVVYSLGVACQAWLWVQE